MSIQDYLIQLIDLLKLPSESLSYIQQKLDSYLEIVPHSEFPSTNTMIKRRLCMVAALQWSREFKTPALEISQIIDAGNELNGRISPKLFNRLVAELNIKLPPLSATDYVPTVLEELLCDSKVLSHFVSFGVDVQDYRSFLTLLLSEFSYRMDKSIDYCAKPKNLAYGILTLLDGMICQYLGCPPLLSLDFLSAMPMRSLQFERRIKYQLLSGANDEFNRLRNMIYETVFDLPYIFDIPIAIEY